METLKKVKREDVIGVGKMFSGHGHYKISVEVGECGKPSCEFSAITTNMTMIDDWNKEDESGIEGSEYAIELVLGANGMELVK